MLYVQQGYVAPVLLSHKGPFKVQTAEDKAANESITLEMSHNLFHFLCIVIIALY